MVVPWGRGPARLETTKPRPGVLEILKTARQLSLNPSGEASPTFLRRRPPVATSEPEAVFLPWVQEGLTLGIYSVGRVEELRSIWASRGRSIHRVLTGTGCPDSQPFPPPGSFPCAKSSARYPARDLGSSEPPKCHPQGNLPLASPAGHIRPPRGSLSCNPCCALTCGPCGTGCLNETLPTLASSSLGYKCARPFLTGSLTLSARLCPLALFPLLSLMAFPHCWLWQGLACCPPGLLFVWSLQFQ